MLQSLWNSRFWGLHAFVRFCQCQCKLEGRLCKRYERAPAQPETSKIADVADEAETTEGRGAVLQQLPCEHKCAFGREIIKAESS